MHDIGLILTLRYSKRVAVYYSIRRRLESTIASKHPDLVCRHSCQVRRTSTGRERESDVDRRSTAHSGRASCERTNIHAALAARGWSPSRNGKGGKALSQLPRVNLSTAERERTAGRHAPSTYSPSEHGMSTTERGLGRKRKRENTMDGRTSCRAQLRRKRTRSLISMRQQRRPSRTELAAVLASCASRRRG